MEIQLVPDPGPEDAAADAARHALTREGLANEPVPPGLTSAWRRAGLDQAMDRELGANGNGNDHANGNNHGNGNGDAGSRTPSGRRG